jgi:S-(hydroxymethyl)glutathione dehydrogenase/alcohol dehydrogenase
VPVFTSVKPVELAMLHCVGGCGLGTTMTLAPVEPGSDVAVFGAGPVGLSAVQGARIMGAAQIIVVEPVRVRRELALRVGATHVFDPNTEGANLVPKIKDLCKGPTDRKLAGGRDYTANAAHIAANIGPDFIIEAVGYDRARPRVEAGPDPTGILPLQQVWQLCPTGGHICTTGVGFPAQATVSFPVNQWTNGSKTHHSSQYGGVNMMRDLPRYVRLIEKGLYDAKSLITSVYPIEKTLDAYQEVADRTTVTAMIVFA